MDCRMMCHAPLLSPSGTLVYGLGTTTASQPEGSDCTFSLVKIPRNTVRSPSQVEGIWMLSLVFKLGAAISRLHIYCRPLEL